MKTIVLALAMIFACTLSFAADADQYRATCSLKITEEGGRMESVSQATTVIAIDSKTDKAQEFLSELWERDRPLFKDAEMNSFGPDARYQVIDFSCGDQKIVARSWHRLAEANPKAVVNSHGIMLLDGKTRETVLAEDEKWYLDFRKAFDDIFDKAMGFKELDSK